MTCDHSLTFDGFAARCVLVTPDGGVTSPAWAMFVRCVKCGRRETRPGGLEREDNRRMVADMADRLDWELALRRSEGVR